MPPPAVERPQLRRHHGDEVSDPYEWLRNKDSSEVRSHLEEENAWTAAQTEHLAELRQEIFDDIRHRTRQTDLSVPELVHHVGGDSYWYYVRTVEGQSYPIYCRAPASGIELRDISAPPADEQILLDVNLEARDHDFYQLGVFAISPDGTRLAYSADIHGDERYDLSLIEVDTGRQLDDSIREIPAGGSWLGNDYFFYHRIDESWRPHQLWRHHLGTPSGTDQLVLTESDERFWLNAGDSRDSRWLVVTSGSKITSECWLLSASTPEATPRSIAGRQQGVEYEVEVAGERLLILHNARNPDFELAEAPLDASSPSDWRTLSSAAEGERFEQVDAYASHAVLSQRRGGLSEIQVFPRDDSGGLLPGVIVEFGESLHEASAHPGANYDTDTVRVTFSSLVTPRQVLELRLDSGKLTVLKQTPVLDHPRHGPYRSSDYVQRRVWAQAPDGTHVPVSVVHHKDVALDGSAPCVLYGYGSYEMSIPPVFSIARLSLLQRGVVYAIAHVRGGGEMGRRWYEQGRTSSKMNTFTDFIAAAETLVADGYTSADRLAARGASAGGLLMGAVANLRPDLFCAIQAGVPFVDCLTSILDPDLPLTVVEWDEWGDPLHDPEAYRYIKAYSPYENVRAQAYPAVLATTSFNDTRVLYVEPAKWVARLRSLATNATEGRILLKTEMQAGHGGLSGRYDAWRDEAFELAWLIDQFCGENPTEV